MLAEKSSNIVRLNPVIVVNSSIRSVQFSAVERLGTLTAMRELKAGKSSHCRSTELASTTEYSEFCNADMYVTRIQRACRLQPYTLAFLNFTFFSQL
ncbi:hypothetical protein EWB00_007701 [Schistosoma japonicum]|uniref:Uncharacterized protein n=1 Tax=Schistosoma japonicum TaxID=6182 RepID=A0A4Z2CU18_SCHJA|nr:hypothetical protein KSF78_0000832 [Schistosoma japonicum]TNN07480.1 hypothetical protein EWB00_007701 [Schistosoma japonicum]